MSWSITLHDAPPARPVIGDAWYWPDCPHGMLSPEYLRDHAGKRPPLVVCIPSRWTGRTDFCVDQPTSSGGVRGGSGWTVTGNAPRITVSPSINIVGDYHGWIRDGVITDDCEGRAYEPHGPRVGT